MTVELRPEHEAIIREQLASGGFASVDEVIGAALKGLHQGRRSTQDAVRRMMQFAQENAVRLAPGETVEQLVRESHRY